jgi:hypothetical protein
MTELLNQVHYRHAQNVVNRPEFPPIQYIGYFHPQRKGSIQLERVESVDWIMDVVNNYTMDIRVHCHIEMDIYKKKIWPSRDNLEFTLVRLERLCEPYGAPTPYPRRYRALIPPDQLAKNNMSTFHTMQDEDMHIAGTMHIQLQLINLFVEPLPYTTIEGSWKPCEREQFIRGTISHALSKVDSSELIQYITMESPIDNGDNTDQIVIPSDTPILSLPQRLQADWGGMYNKGMLSFICKWGGTNYRKVGTFNHWFIQNLYDPTNWMKVDEFDKLIMHVVPDTKKSWNVYDHTWDWYPIHDTCIPPPLPILEIYVKRIKEPGDTQEARHTIRPTGYRADYHEELVTTPVSVKPDGVYGSGNRLNKTIHFDRNVKKDEIDGSDVNFDWYPTHYKQSTQNYQVAATNMVKNRGTRMDFLWNNSDPELLKPGMQMQMVWEEEKAIRVTYGQLMYAHTLCNSTNKQWWEHGKHELVTYYSVYVKDLYGID